MEFYRRRSRLLGTFALFAAALACCLQPWRNVVGQDDASYAVFADLIKMGRFSPPELLLAAAWPQALMGAGFSSVLPFIPALASYMLVSFLVFLAVFFIFSREIDRSWSALLWCVSVFIFPVTLQYGSAFLTEMYVVLFLVAFFSSLRGWLATRRPRYAVGLIVATILIILQRQTFLIFPAASMAILVFQSRTIAERKALWPIAMGLIVAVFVYLFIPKSFLQSAMLSGVLEKWHGYPSHAYAFVVFCSRMVQLILAIGLFLTPLIFFVEWSVPKFLKALISFLSLATIVYLAPGDPLTAGVLFTNYLPRVVGSVFIALGTWGIFALLSQAKDVARTTVIIATLAATVFLAFTVFFDASDVKYVLPAALGLLFVRLAFVSSETELGRVSNGQRFIVVYVVIVGAVSLLANRYYLDTLDARFAAAEHLRTIGVGARNVSAGYGHDSYVVGEDCVRSAQQKISRMPETERAFATREHLIRSTPRQYEDGAVFNFIVKPYEIFGKRLQLATNRLSGQSDEPIETIEYKVFGLPNALAIYKNSSPQLAWCFQ